MRAELVVFLATVCACLGVYTTNPMFPMHNRPEVFRGTRGDLFFTGVVFSILIAGGSLLVWSFLAITWYVNLLLIVGSMAVFAVAYPLLPMMLTRTAIGSIVSAVALVFLSHWAWFGHR